MESALQPLCVRTGARAPERCQLLVSGGGRLVSRGLTDLPPRKCDFSHEFEVGAH